MWSGVESSLLTRLERYRLRPRKSHASHVRGERISPRKGISIEFADYRHYAPGDDLRHLDWNILARLDRTHIRTYRDEQELSVYLLMDASPSMEFGEPPKLNMALSLAACIGYIALCGSDALYPVALPSPLSEIRPLRGRAAYRRLQEWLGALKPEGGGLAASLHAFVRRAPYAGMAFLISDGLDPDLPESLRTLSARKHELILLHLLSDAELAPDLEGDLRLVDAETRDAVELTATAGVLAEYRRRLEAHCQNLEGACRRVGGIYLQLRSDEPVETVIFRRLRRAGMIG